MPRRNDVSELPRFETYLLKAPPGLLEEARKAAKRNGDSLAHWIRTSIALRLEIPENDPRVGMPVERPPDYRPFMRDGRHEGRKIRRRRPTTPAPEPLPDEVLAVAKQAHDKVMVERCPRRRQHRKGVYCKHCGQVA